MKKQKDIFAGILILFIVFFIGIVIAIIVVESNIPSSASNDGWLGFLGGLLGSVISGLVAYYILYVNRKETINLQDKQKKQFEYQIRRQFTDNIVEILASYITDINGYFYNQCINDPDIKPDRKIAVEKYFVLQMKLYQIKEAETLLHLLAEVYNKSLFQRESPQAFQQMEEFKQLVEKLEDESKKFIYEYSFGDSIS